MQSLFMLGQIVVPTAIVKKLKREPLDLIARHAVCDHGDVSLEQRRANQRALDSGEEIVSRYLIDPTDKSKGYVIITTVQGWGLTRATLEKKP